MLEKNNNIRIIRKFQVNEFLWLRLVGDKTMIYVGYEEMRRKGERMVKYIGFHEFIQCKFLLINIKVDEISTFDEIESIDEAAEKLDKTLEPADHLSRRDVIPPEVEFWGHCSNLQVWYEHDYDTRLLHSNISFPLLRKLTEAGDPLAKKVFRQEIIKRYENGTDTTREFLNEGRYYQHLKVDERLHVWLNDNDFTALLELYDMIRPLRYSDTDKDYMGEYALLDSMIEYGEIIIDDRKVIELNLKMSGLKKFPKCILKFKGLEVLNLSRNGIRKLPKDINKLSNLKTLWLMDNKINTLPDTFCKLKNLEIFALEKNKLEKLPDNIGNLTNLKSFSLSSNLLKKIPNSIFNLKRLEQLSLGNNLLKKLPHCFIELKSLKYLNLKENPFTKYPKILKKMTNVKKIVI